MTRKRKRLLVVLLGLGLLSIATGLVIWALNSEGATAFFRTPTEVAAKSLASGERIRLGGLVEVGSVTRDPDGRTIKFRVTDGNAAVPVTYDIANGPIPDLFRESQGVVVEGNVLMTGIFKANTLLAKHDERYMPPEVADALKKAGHWQGEHPPATSAQAKP